MLGGVSTVAMASPAIPSTSTAKANVAVQQKAYDNAQSQLEAAQTNLEQISNEISNLTRQINENNVQITNNEKQLKIFTAEYQKDLQMEASRIKSIYQNDNNNGFLSLMLSSKNLGQVISRFYAINKLMQLDHQAVEKTQTAKNSMDATQKKLTDLKSSNEAKLASLTSKKADAQTLLTKMQSNSAYQSQKLEQAKATAAASIELLQKATTVNEATNAVTALKHIANTTTSSAIKAQVNDAINNSQTKINDIKTHTVAAPVQTAVKSSAKPAQTPAKPDVAPAQTSVKPDATPAQTPVKPDVKPAAVANSGSASGQAIVSYAMNFLGRPYVWGALGPNAFDCSGLTHYVYAHFGYQIGDDTYSQINQGTPVSLNNLQPGDLIFWGGDSPYHVAIYIGGGEYIQAPKPGSNVDISSWNFKNVTSARRIL
ncbi:MAG: NlpC/P60 family protein [Sarcina sp.]